MQLHRVLLASLIAAARGWVVPPTIGASLPAAGCATAMPAAATPAFARRMGGLRMEDAAEGSAAEGAVAEPAADAVSDFTEDLLEALTTDDEPLVDDVPAVVVPGAAGVEPEQLSSFTNAESITAMRSKCVHRHLRAAPAPARTPAAHVRAAPSRLRRRLWLRCWLSLSLSLC